MKKTDSTKKESPSFKDEDFDIQACAAMDCTGLIPSLPLSDAELESYNELYGYLPDAKNAKEEP